MPTSTQALYFQLGMNADDDGFVGPKKIMRMVGANEDDLKILLVKKFCIPFDSGVIVIRHWKVNNLVRRDWYRPSIHAEEKSQLKLLDSGTYLLVNETTPSSVTQVGSKVGNYKGKPIEEQKTIKSEKTDEIRKSIGSLLAAKKL